MEAWAFADEHDLGVGVALAGYAGRARLAQAAQAAAAHLAADYVQCVPLVLSFIQSKDHWLGSLPGPFHGYH